LIPWRDPDTSSGARSGANRPVMSLVTCFGPASARARLGIAPCQHNALVRLVLRALDRTLTHAECNVLRDEVYAALYRPAPGALSLAQ
jgi:hypothetical protein